jgi:hypothetical protein
MSVRVAGSVRDALEAAAEKSGRSLTSECETRLEFGLRDEARLLDVLDLVAGPHTAGLLCIIVDLVNRQDWLNDPVLFEEMHQRIELVFEALSPGQPTQQAREEAARRDPVTDPLGLPPAPPEQAVVHYFATWTPGIARRFGILRDEALPRLGDTATLRALRWSRDHPRPEGRPRPPEDKR